ncbi:MAG: sporulation protein YabP [Clostridiales bacterium]|jgi:sporulation protein YabP|nr:sporulation protein YabP [Clostridiales bacterium]
MHNLYIEDRKLITISEVTEVDNFDEESILLTVQGSNLLLKGQNLHIQKLDLEEGKAVISGTLNSVNYSEKKNKSEGGFLKKMLK